MPGRSVALALGVSAITGWGCFPTGKTNTRHMEAVAYVNTVPEANEAVIVFARVSDVYPWMQASVFELPEHGPARLIGLVAAKRRIAFRTTPGRHTFMVIGDDADFMDADLQPGRLYHAVARVRLGVGTPSFELVPVRAAERGQLAGWLADVTWVETTHEALTWAHENAADIEAKRSEYYPKWMQKASSQRPALLPEDGQ